MWLANHVLVLLVLGLSICTLLFAWLWWRVKNSPGGEDVVVVPPRVIIVPQEFEHQLDRFRQPWDIRDRFETWPALPSLMKVSLACYQADDYAVKIYSELGFGELKTLSCPLHTQVCHVLGGEEVMVIAFRGTDDPEDWIQNLNQYHHKSEDGAIHAGFAMCYSTMRTELAALIKEKSPKYLWITGHSLGGALALVCAYDLERYHGQRVTGIFTFGQPMVGREQFAVHIQNQLGTRFVHFVNGQDLVPRLPIGYAHSGLLIWFDNGIVKMSRKYKSLIAASAPEFWEVSDSVQYVDELPVMEEQTFRRLQAELRSEERKLFPQDVEIPDNIDPFRGVPKEWNRFFRDKDKNPNMNEEEEQLLKGLQDREWDELPFDGREFRSGESRANSSEFSMNFLWSADHEMARYVEVIETAIRQAHQGSGNR